MMIVRENESKHKSVAEEDSKSFELQVGGRDSDENYLACLLYICNDGVAGWELHG